MPFQVEELSLELIEALPGFNSRRSTIIDQAWPG
jgi:hypothetical protein